MKKVIGHERVTTFIELKENVKLTDIQELINILDMEETQRINKVLVNGIPYCNWCDRTKTGGIYKIDRNLSEITFLVSGELHTLEYSSNGIKWK